MADGRTDAMDGVAIGYPTKWAKCYITYPWELGRVTTAADCDDERSFPFSHFTCHAIIQHGDFYFSTHKSVIPLLRHMVEFRQPAPPPDCHFSKRRWVKISRVGGQNSNYTHHRPLFFVVAISYFNPPSSSLRCVVLRTRGTKTPAWSSFSGPSSFYILQSLRSATLLSLLGKDEKHNGICGLLA